MNIYTYLSKEELDTYTYIKVYKAKDVVFNEESDCHVIGMIESGQINVIELTYTEKEETITILKDKAYFGDILAFSNDNRYLGHGICFKRTIVRYITKDNILKLFKTNFKFLEAYLMLISTKALNLKQENKMGVMPIGRLLASMAWPAIISMTINALYNILIYYFKIESNRFNSSKICIDSVSNLARILSLPRPSVSRSLSKMEKKNIIAKKNENNKTYILLKKLI